MPTLFPTRNNIPSSSISSNCVLRLSACGTTLSFIKIRSAIGSTSRQATPRVGITLTRSLKELGGLHAWRSHITSRLNRVNIANWHLPSKCRTTNLLSYQASRDLSGEIFSHSSTTWTQRLRTTISNSHYLRYPMPSSILSIAVMIMFLENSSNHLKFIPDDSWQSPGNTLSCRLVSLLPNVSVIRDVFEFVTVFLHLICSRLELFAMIRGFPYVDNEIRALFASQKP